MLQRAAILTVGAALLAPTASAHDTIWYWSRARAEARIEERGLLWKEGLDLVRRATCRGIPPSIPSKQTRYLRLYRHFRCSIQTRDLDRGPYLIIFHVLGRDRWTFSFVRHVGRG